MHSSQVQERVVTGYRCTMERVMTGYQGTQVRIVTGYQSTQVRVVRLAKFTRINLLIFISIAGPSHMQEIKINKLNSAKRITLNCVP